MHKVEWNMKQEIKRYNDENLETAYGNDDGALVGGRKMRNWDTWC